MSGFFFDARYIRVGQHDGISRFSAGLIQALVKQMAVTAIISDLRQLEKLPSGIQFVKINDPTSIAEPLAALKLNRLGAKVVFSPMQTIGSFGRKFKLILTVHDLIYYRHPTPPSGFNPLVRGLWRLYHLVYWPQRVLLNRADAIATVSFTTKKLIAKHNLTRRPVSVVYNAAAEEEVFESPTTSPKAKSLVYMGSFMEYKNTETLIRGMQWLPEYELNLLSRISEERKAQLSKLIPAGGKVNFLNGVSEEQYHQLLVSSTALVSASRDEGFGIPLVEAMSRGIPVVVSDIEIFKEIGGEAAHYFHQDSPEEFAKTVLVLGNAADWQAASAKCQIQAKKFSWTKSSEALIEVIESLN